VLHNTYYTCELIDFVEQVLAGEGKAKAIAFDDIDKAPEEKARGITIATVRLSSFSLYFFLNSYSNHAFCKISWWRFQLSPEIIIRLILLIVLPGSC